MTTHSQRANFFNNQKNLRFPLVLALLNLLLLSACGGGGGGAAVPAAPQTPAPLVISGVVTKGTAFDGFSVTAVNPGGALGSPVLVEPDGTYTITFPAEVKLPIVLTASRQTGTGEVESYSAIVADKTNTVANITPITNLIASLLSSNGRPDQLSTQVSSGAPITQEALNAKTQIVQGILKSALDTLGVANIDPLKSKFSPNDLGYGKLLDSLAINITPSGTSANIEVALKTRPSSDDAQPAATRFLSSQTVVPALPLVAASDFPIDGISIKLKQLATDAQNCYALPLSSRISGVAPNALSAVGNASLISSPLCRGIFFENNPAKYLNSSAVVGRDENGFGAFSALYFASSTGTKFENPRYEYSLKNGDIGISFQTTLPGSNPQLFTNTVRLDPSDQKLKFIGDQFQFNGRVLPLMLSSEFPVLNQAQWNYLSTGYTVNVDNTGQFQRVEVIAPTGTTYTLEPSIVITSLTFVGKGPSNFLRLRSEFTDTSKNFSVPAKLPTEASAAAFETNQLSDQSVASIPSLAAWTFRYFRSGNTGSVPDVVQVYRTRSRALSISELRNRPIAGVATATQSSWVSSASTATGRLPLTTSAPVSATFTVPTGAVSPISASVFGKFVIGSLAVTADFTDSVFIPPNVQAAIIPCSVSSGDGHCDGGTNGGFKVGSEATGLSLTGVDFLGRNFSTKYSFLTLTVSN
jgi:hypothetical protein